MSSEIISKKTRYEFREYLTGWVLRTIEMEFDAADIPCAVDYAPPVSGQRRALVEQYYKSLDFSKWDDAKKFLKVYENVLGRIEDVPEDFNRLKKWMEKDGFNFQNGRLEPASGITGLQQTKAIAFEFDSEYLSQQIKRIEDHVNSDPSLALGTAKELIETCCKTILRAHGKPVIGNPDMPSLVKDTAKELKLVPDGIPEEAKGSEIIKRLLSNLTAISNGMAELRNLYGSGHGRDGKAKGLMPRHARLACGAATTLVIFLFETHKERYYKA